MMQKENVLKSTEVDTYRIEEKKSQILDAVVKQYFIGSMPISLSWAHLTFFGEIYIRTDLRHVLFTQN